MTHRIFLVLGAMLWLWQLSSACTTAIISGKATADGRPILWKHRDTRHTQNAIRYFSDGRYAYIGLVNAEDKSGNEVWAGVNSAGFAIMNSVAYNLKSPTDTTQLQDMEGEIMKRALQNCATLQDFEKLLDTLAKPLGVETNFGVIDAQGGAAYYETDNWSYRKLDVNDPSVAPFGFLVHSNFSFYGRPGEGHGYIRYRAAEQLLQKAVLENQLNERFILQQVSRELIHGLTGVNLWENLPDTSAQADYVCFRDFIPRHSSVSVFLVKGVQPGENPLHTMAWTILGFPLTSVAYPLWLSAGDHIPGILSDQGQAYAPLCHAALQLKKRCFPISAGSGRYYLNRTALINRQGTGILQHILQLESYIFQRSAVVNRELIQNGSDTKKIARFYWELDREIEKFYREKFKIALNGNESP